jgi:methionine-rich copper-binding protein CopC
MNHSMLASSDPADGAVLDQAPQVLTLNFQHFVTLQTATIKSGGGTPVAPTWRRAEHPARSYAISLPALADGAYEVAFIATGTGGTDAMPGRIRFTVR